MEVAYNLNCPCQIIIKRGTENIINQENYELLENVPVTVCVSEVLIPQDYKSKEEWFNKVGDVWDKTNESVNKCKMGKEIIAPLPGVNTDLCIDEKISENAIVYSVSVLIGLVALCYALYHIWNYVVFVVDRNDNNLYKSNKSNNSPNNDNENENRSGMIEKKKRME